MDALSKTDFSFHKDCSSSEINNVEQCILKWKSSDSFFEFETSGSTGKPKLINFSRDQILSSIKSTAEKFDFFKGMRSALALNTKSIGGALMVFRAIEWEMDFQIVPVRRKIEWQGSLDFLALVPQQAMLIPIDNYKNLKTLLIGGSPIRESQENFLSNVSSQVFHGFGMTETITHFAIREINPKKQVNYHCLKGVEITSSDGAMVVSIKDRGVFQLKTTDRIKLSRNRKSFYWLGRLDGAIISAGKKIHPKQIEDHVSRVYPSHPEGFVGVKPDENWDEAMVWFSVSLSGVELEKMNNAFNSLPSWKRPKQIIQLSHLPLTKSGKYKRR